MNPRDALPETIVVAIEALTFRQLGDLEHLVFNLKTERRESGLQKLTEEFEAKAESFGLTVPELAALAKAAKRKRRRVQDEQLSNGPTT